ncbi:MAG: hypothetical protein E7162_03480 [Firmicutes bacterium]|nr:hypothetical protein [Bacillota bacterium]
MLKRIILFLIGFILTVIGFTFIIIYLNLTTMGYSFLEYLKYIFQRIECLFGLVGIILIIISLYEKGGKSLDIYL